MPLPDLGPIGWLSPHERSQEERGPVAQGGPAGITAADYLAWAKTAAANTPQQPNHDVRPTLEQAEALQQALTCCLRDEMPHTLTGTAPPDIMIHNLQQLPQRQRIRPSTAGPNIALQERIRIQETGDYPTIERHAAGETPIYWAWQPGYDSPTLVPYRGRFFRKN